MPTLTHEKRIGGIVAGVDEVGRGPLAGPVLAAAVILPKKLPRKLVALIDDSKKMTALNRELAFLGLRESGAIIALGAASVTEIAEINILHAAMLAMRRALSRLPQTPDHVLVDGNRAPACTIPCTPIIGGDAVSLSIAAASIAAKVVRDRLMARLCARYPGYGWSKNAGYAAATHRAAILSLGPTPHHRMAFGELLRSLQPPVGWASRSEAHQSFPKDHPCHRIDVTTALDSL